MNACNKDKVDLSGDITYADGWALVEVQTNLDDLAPKVVASLSGDDLARIGLNPSQLTALLLETAANLETIFPCEDDDTYFFKPDGKLVFDKGGRACYPNAPEQEGFFRGMTTWVQDGVQLTITDEEETYMFNILKLSANILQIESETVFQEQRFGISYDAEKLRFKLTFFVR